MLQIDQIEYSFVQNLLSNSTVQIIGVISAILGILLFFFPNIRMWIINSFKKVKTRFVLIFTNPKLYKIQEQVTFFLKSEEGQKYLINHSNKELKQKVYSSFDKLKKNKVVSQIEEDVYYIFLFSLLEKAQSRIWAASISDPKEWTETYAEKLFLELNIKTAKRKVPVERIFIIKETEAIDFLNIEPIKTQIRENEISEYYFAYYVYESQVPRSLIRDISNGFLAFDDFVVAKDVFSDNEIRGILETESLAFYNKIFTKLRQYTNPLDSSYYKLKTGDDLAS